MNAQMKTTLMAAFAFFALGTGSVMANKLAVMNCTSQRVMVCVYNSSDPVTKYSTPRHSVKMGKDGYSTGLKCSGNKKCKVKIVKSSASCRTQVSADILLTARILRRASYVLKSRNLIKKVSSNRKHFRNPRYNTCAENK